MSDTGPWKDELAKGFVQKLAVTLKYCHEIGVSHRDLKCDNILIDQSDHFVLIDFAFSSSSFGGKKSETYCGTPQYMSPEIVSKLPYCPKKADVWALGIITYKLVAGDHPFHGNIRIID